MQTNGQRLTKANSQSIRTNRGLFFPGPFGDSLKYSQTPHPATKNVAHYFRSFWFFCRVFPMRSKNRNKIIIIKLHNTHIRTCTNLNEGNAMTPSPSIWVSRICFSLNLFNFVPLFWGICWEQLSSRQMRFSCLTTKQKKASLHSSQGLEMQPKNNNISWLLAPWQI